MRLADMSVAVIIVVVVLMLVLPMPTFLLDTLIIINIAIALMIMMVALFIQEALQFSSFPSLLLVVTLFRLALNVSSTKLILSNGGDAGNVIKTFGSFVIGGNLVVGVIVFLIILVIQFIVITKGAERVAEVAARFTLDAMPGKQMAIDADLNSGLIDEQGAKERRLKIQREADFFGSMDGASKFVKGDAIISILITFINIIGGLIIGSGSMSTDQVIQVYTLATVGDGLVSQIPALLISTATGIIVTRSSSQGTLGSELSYQLFGSPMALMTVGGIVLLLAFVPGMPVPPIVLISGLLLVIGFLGYRASRPEPDTSEDEAAEMLAQEKRKPENVMSLLEVHLIEMELGYGVTPLVDVSQGGDLLDRVVMIRRQCAMDLGILVPTIRVRDNIQIGTNQYLIKMKGVEVARGEVMMDHYLALSGGQEGDERIRGIETLEPAFGLPALWITQGEREKADLLGYTTIDPPSVIATHLTEVIKRHAYELLTRQQVQLLVENLKRQQPALVEEVIPKMFSLGELQQVLANLLNENVAIRDMLTIVETLGDYGHITRDTDMLTEYVRQNLRRAISRRFIPDNKARVITLDPNLEQLMLDRLKQSEQGTYVAMEPDKVQGIFQSLRGAIERMTGLGMTPIVLTSPLVRKHFKRITEQFLPDLVVLSYNEVENDVEIYSDGVVSIS